MNGIKGLLKQSSNKHINNTYISIINKMHDNILSIA